MKIVTYSIDNNKRYVEENTNEFRFIKRISEGKLILQQGISCWTEFISDPATGKYEKIYGTENIIWRDVPVVEEKNAP